MSAWCQRVACAGILVAFLACLLGAVSPYWRQGQLLTNSTGFHGGNSSISKVERSLSYHCGIFYYCVDIPGGGTECDIFDYYSGGGAEISVLWLTVGQITFGLLSLLTSLCCLSRTKDQARWYRCQGLSAGLVGLCGIVATVMYLVSPNDSWDLTLTSLSNSWALAVYAAGAGIFTLVSLGLCLASPDGICPCLVIRRRGYEDVDKQTTEAEKSVK